MKRSIFIMFIMASLCVLPSTAMATEKHPTNPTPHPVEIPAHVQKMINRIDEIKEMDKSALSREEKKELRKELREIRQEVRSTGSGVYISVGALLLIIILLIIIT